MATTTNYAWDKPIVGGDPDTWGTKANTLYDDIDADLKVVADSVAGKLTASNNLSDVVSAPAARANLGLSIGSNIQAYDAGLQSIAGLTTVADRMIYTTASDTYAASPLTSFARSLLDDGDAGTARTTLGLGSASTYATGTSGVTVPLLSTANTWSLLQTFTTIPQMDSGRKAMRISGAGTNAGRVSYGTAAPGTLDAGEIYLQHQA